ncbi:MAG: serine/threonine protein kinase, partial [Chloroflexi bacterium]|nr:serine/threonine protein kinase [Chloroflexota bacterium]
MSSILEGGRLGRYHIQEQLGRGGMATVFKARDPSLNRTVAIKVLAFLRADEPAFRERFGREAQAIARLNHPNILQVFDVGEDKGFTYIVTEYVSGGTLLDRLGSPYNLEDSLRILRPLAEALDYAHASGIVHRDIKPSNVLMNDDAEPVLADFGLSVAMEQ